MTSTNRPILLLWFAVFALSCGSVTGLSTDAATDKGGTAGGAGGGASGTGGSTGQAGSSGAGSTGSGGTASAGTSGSGGGGTTGIGGAGGTTGTAGAGGVGAASGTSGHAGAGGSTGTGGAGGQGGTGGQGGAGGSGACSAACARGRMCCGGACVNLDNDPMNCGTCGMRCEGASNLCSGGTCVPPSCSVAGGVCAANSFCCGGGCCLPGQLCCQAEGPISGGAPTCFTPTSDQKTCAQGCAPLCVSDRNQKKNIAPVDAAAILDKVGRLPISSWTYNKESAEVRHLGPMAQDFRAAFGLGDDDRTYYSVDAQGVALAAIKALNEQVTAQEARIERLERENQSLARRLREVGRNRR
jgi:trimeric autotransporter adhesin